MYVLEWRTVSGLTRGLFWCLFPELRSREGNKHQNNTGVSTETVCYESTYIISFLTWHKKSINDDKNDDLCTLSLCLTRLFFTRGQFWPSGIVVACVCVCVCVCLSVCLCVNHLLVRAITRDPFKLGSPNLDRRCKRPWLRSLLFWGAIDLDLQGQI